MGEMDMHSNKQLQHDRENNFISALQVLVKNMCKLIAGIAAFINDGVKQNFWAACDGIKASINYWRFQEVKAKVFSKSCVSCYPMLLLRNE